MKANVNFVYKLAFHIILDNIYNVILNTPIIHFVTIKCREKTAYMWDHNAYRLTSVVTAVTVLYADCGELKLIASFLVKLPLQDAGLLQGHIHLSVSSARLYVDLWPHSREDFLSLEHLQLWHHPRSFYIIALWWQIGECTVIWGSSAFIWV